MGTDSHATSSAMRVVGAAAAFEAAWKEGRGPRIEDALGPAAGPGRDALFLRLLAVEIDLRRCDGERPAPAEYKQRFPEHAGLVDAAFADGRSRAEAAGGLTFCDDHLGEQALVTVAFETHTADPDDLLAAFSAWAADPRGPLARALVASGCLDGDGLGSLERLLAERVGRNGGDPGRVVEAFRSLGPAERAFADRLCLRLKRARGEPGPGDWTTVEYFPTGCPIGAATEPMTEPPAPPDPEALPQQIGRYRVVGKLGRGGFGAVYLGRDDDLERPVAIKVPNPGRISRPEDVEAFLAEARHLARLDHPNIVPVFDVGRTPDGLCYVVSKFIEGEDLAARLRHGPVSHVAAAELVAAVADALHYAHVQGLVHRDVKPANILLDASGRPVVADFGLALKDEDFGKIPSLAGTPAYMSPEQARGEGHLVDGRSDVFSLGVVLYEMLTGRKPFRGDNVEEILWQVANADVRPLRQVVDSVPKELERVCLKALSKRATDRYPTARDMADDLHHFVRSAAALASPTATTVSIATESAPFPREEPSPSTNSGRSDGDARPVRVVPKGLRAFDEHDADFFLELLAGARDREGLPESLRFWKTRVEEVDPDRTFRVGLVYGPSGCGKSSLVKAGLLPRLARHVGHVYVEATAEGTETRLLRGLRKACPALPDDRGLVESFAALRRGGVLRPGKKVLVVLDQFEQWLFAHAGGEDGGLVDALRQCDGEHVQAIILLRDDFWLAASRFMRALEVRLVEGENSALVDLFDARHARVVLTAFGKAYGALPARTAEFSPDHKAFLAQSVADLAQDGKVVPVRLALFAEMVKGKPWTPATLKAVGGTEGVGVTFLEETFGAATAPPEHRLHQKAARAVLKSLLPDSGTHIKGRMLPEAALRDASGYAGRPADFDDLIRILDNELRLITPADPEGLAGLDPPAPAGGGRDYQLTHDYLVHSLRDWLTRKQRETRKGRAELNLAERAELWDAKPENRRLPSLAEWVNIRVSTDRKDWTEPQRRMMAVAARRYLARIGWAALFAALATTVVAVSALRAKSWRRQSEVRGLVSQLLVAEWDRLPAILERLQPERPLWWDDLVRVARDGPPGERMRALLAIAPHRPSAAVALLDDLASASPQQLRIAWGQLAPWKDRLRERLWERMADPDLPPEARCRYACLLARGDPQGDRWAVFADRVVAALVEEKDPLLLTAWVAQLHPARAALVGPLARTCLDPTVPEDQRLVATSALAELAADKPDRLASVMLDGDDRQNAILFRVVSRDRDLLASRMARALAEEPSGPASGRPGANRRANAALTMARLGRWDAFWPLLAQGPDPGLRTQLIHRVHAFGLPPSGLAEGLRGPQPPSVRQAVLLALGGFPAERLSPRERDAVVAECLRLYRADPDAGVHSGAEWLLRKWGLTGDLASQQAALAGRPSSGGWYVNKQGQTMITFPGPVTFTMGSPDSEPQRDLVEVRHARLIDRGFAIGAHEVTLEEFRRYDSKFEFAGEVSPYPGSPATRVSWVDAVRYCRWLTKEEGLPESQQCYPEGAGPNTPLPDNFFARTGYRLPTDAEWEYACRAGSVTSRFFGEDEAFLADYAWFSKNADDHLWPAGLLKPNPWGLFDVYGNALEWCQNAPFVVEPGMTVTPVRDDRFRSGPDEARVLRGGGYRYSPRETRSAKRFLLSPETKTSFSGLRVARTVR